jgi:dTDP-4-amino-4,6-dideoxygalactose transaminase
VVLKNSDFNFRDLIRSKLAEAGIQTSVHYPAVHRFSIYKPYYVELPITDYVADCLITLPMYSKLTTENVLLITNLLKKFLSDA